jgi:hypothetical protein
MADARAQRAALGLRVGHPIREAAVKAQALAFASVLLFALAACKSPTLSEASSGSLSLSASLSGLGAQRALRSSSPAKTSFPTSVDLSTLAYTLSLTSATSSSSPISGGTSATGSFATVGSIPVGEWTASVTAVASGVTIGAGGAAVTIAANSTASVSVDLAPPSSGTGTLALSCAWSYAAVPSVTITPVNPSGAATTPVSSGASPLSYSATLAPGVYRVDTSLDASSVRQWGASEIVYIFSGLTTSLGYSAGDTSYKTSAVPGAPTVSASSAYLESSSGIYAYVSWTGVSGATSYVLERRSAANTTALASATYATLSSTLTTSSYTDSGLADNYYEYRVTAVNLAGSGPTASATVSNFRTLTVEVAAASVGYGIVSVPSSGSVQVLLGDPTTITAVAGTGTFSGWTVDSGLVASPWYSNNASSSVRLISTDATVRANFNAP